LSAQDGDLNGGAGPGLALDDTHTLVAVEPQDLEALWRPDTGAVLGWLLFRSASGVGPAANENSVELPTLWFSVGGRRISAELREAAGWGQLGGAAVALFELPAEGEFPRGSPDSESRSACGVVDAGQEFVVGLPGSWAERLAAAWVLS